MTDAASKTERFAENSVFKLIARASMTVAAPALIGLVALVLDMRAQIIAQAGQVTVIETRLTARIAALEDRLGAQSRRMDLTDQRIERLADLTGKFAVDTAVLAEQIRALIAASQPLNRPGALR
jgi:hypothetical protein